MAWHRRRFRISRVRVRGDAPCARPRGRREDRAQAETQPRARSSDRGEQARAHLLGQGVVRQPGVVPRLREPPSTRQELCPARGRHRSADRRRQGRRPGERDIDLRGRRDDSVAAAEELEQARVRVHQADRLVGRSAARHGCRRRSWSSSRASRAACFPAPNEISFECSCPDWAGMCKHVAAALYGVGVRLEEKPELFFELRGVDHTELVGGAAEAVPRLADGQAKRPQGGQGRRSLRRSSESSWSPRRPRSQPPAWTAPGDRSRTRAQVPKARRAKAAKETDSATPSHKAVAQARGTRRPQKEPRNPKSH